MAWPPAGNTQKFGKVIDDTSNTCTSLHSIVCVKDRVSLLSAATRLSMYVFGTMIVRIGTQPARTRSTILGSASRGRPKFGFNSAPMDRHILRIATFAPTCEHIDSASLSNAPCFEMQKSGQAKQGCVNTKEYNLCTQSIHAVCEDLCQRHFRMRHQCQEIVEVDACF